MNICELRDLWFKSYNNNKDYVDSRVAEGIEKHRKGDFKLHLGGGKKKVKITHKKHSFLFGTTAFMLDSFEKPEKEAEYKKLFANLFNQAVVPLYWSDLEPEEGKPRFKKDSVNIYRRPPVDMVLDFCKEYGIALQSAVKQLVVIACFGMPFCPSGFSKRTRQGRRRRSSAALPRSLRATPIRSLRLIS